MKKLLLTSIALIVFHLGCCAYEFTVGGIRYNTLTDNTVEVIGYDNNTSQIKCLELVRYNGVTYTVTSIKEGALKGCSNLISVVIPNTMTVIGYEMFGGCSGLTAVPIPNSVTSIGERAFYGCSSLTAVSIPNSVTSIGERAFYGCEALTSVTIPNSVTSIGKEVFYGCEALTSVTIPNSVTSIGKEVFYGCEALTSVTIPNSVTSIGEGAFSECKALTSVTIPNSVTSIGNFTFYGCKALTSVTIPNSVTSIGERTFQFCNSLTSVTIPNSVTSIGERAFYWCEALTSVIIPNSVTSIGKEVFSGCEALTSVTIPNSVTSIGDYAFSGCYALTSVTIPNSVTSIGYLAFKDCSLTSVKVEQNNRVYDSRDNCNAIIETKSNTLIFGFKNTTIPNSVTSIGDYAFYRCEALTSVTIPNSVTSIGDYAFYNCSSLKSITCYAAFPPDVASDTFNKYTSNSIYIYVPCESIDYYPIYWPKEFTYKCITADEVRTDTNSKVTPNATSAVIVWSVERDADRFKIAVTNNGNLVFTIYINSKGQITSIEYAEGGTRGAELRAATATYKGFKYEMIGLNPNTEYEYTVTTYNINDGVLRTDTGNFKTLKEIVGIEEKTDNTNTLKETLSINGKELTVSGTEPSDIKIYNTAGQQVGNPVPAAGVYVVKVGDEAVKILVK